MTRAQTLYLVIVLTAVAFALVPLTMIIAAKRAASEPVLYVIPYKVPAFNLHDGVFRPRRSASYWKAVVRGMTGLPMVV